MLNLFPCEHCGTRFSVPAAPVESKATCPACHKISHVPAVASATLREPIRTPEPEPRPAKANSQWGLRGTVILCGILALISCTVLASFWRSEQQLVNSDKLGIIKLFQGLDDTGKIKAELAEFDLRGKMYPLLFTAAAAGLLGALLATLRYGVAAGLVMIAAVVGPALFAPYTLIFTGFLIVGGIVALFIRSASATPRRFTRGTRKLLNALGVLGLVAVLGYAVLIGYVLVSAYEKHQASMAKLSPEGSTTPPANDFAPASATRPGSSSPTNSTNPATPPVAVTNDSATAGSNETLVKLDLGPAGLDATIEVPEGCTLKESYGTISIIKDASFALKIEPGRVDFVSFKNNLDKTPAFVNSEELVFHEQRYCVLHSKSQ